jgi:RND superfamily putative drug exporter
MQALTVQTITGWSVRHRKAVVLGWLVLVVALFAAGRMLPAKNVPAYDAGQSGQAEQILDRLKVTTLPAETVLIQARGGPPFNVNPGMRQAATSVVTALRALPRSATDIRSPLGPGGTSLVSADGHSALVRFNVPGSAGNENQAAAADLRAVAAVQARYKGVLIAEAGGASESRAISAMLDSDFRKAEDTSVPIALIVLVAVFGTLIAACIPLLIAATAVVSAISLLSILGEWLPVQNAAEVVVIVGMAVGVDYCLFYLRRMREERAAGRSAAEAVRAAAATSGRAVLVSGLTVMITLAGLFLSGYSTVTGIAAGAIIVVGMAVAGSLTVLPALLSWLGRAADRGKVPVLGRRRTAARPSRLWAALVRRVVRHPLAWGGAALVATLALAAPALGMHLSFPVSDVPDTMPVVQTMGKIQQAFPQAPSPAQVVVTGAGLTGPQVRAAITALQARASAGGPVRPPVTATAVAGGRALLVDVPLAGNGTNATSDDALYSLRSRILPATLGRVSQISYTVGGQTATDYDDTRQLATRTPLVLGAVAVLAFCLLLLTFRSLTLPLVSIGLNLLSVGAAYGVLTLIFQDGRFQGVLGYTSYGAIVPYVPLLAFVFLFGLSTDYHVFIISRIRELRFRGTPTRQAITDGISASAGTVTSAAIIMVAVFAVFAGLHLLELKMIGIALPAAILLDATIIRGILLPAAMALLGERCWHMPRWPARRTAAPAMESADAGAPPHARRIPSS